MVLRPLIRTLAFGAIDLLYNVPCALCCMILTPVKHVLFKLNNIS